MERDNFKSLQGAAKDLAEAVSYFIDRGKIELGTRASAAVIRAHTTIAAILELETEDQPNEAE